MSTDTKVSDLPAKWRAKAKRIRGITAGSDLAADIMEGAAEDLEAALARQEADIAAPRSAPAAAGVPTMSNVGLRKLSELQAQGYVVNGVSIIDPESSKRGLIDSLGYVGWHTPEQQAAQAAAPAVGLEQFRRLAESWRNGWGAQGTPTEIAGECADELIELIDQQAGKGVDRE